MEEGGVNASKVVRERIIFVTSGNSVNSATMSLVIAYLGNTYQLWCSDGLTIIKKEQGYREISQTTKKIDKHPSLSVLWGWSGDKENAELISNELRLIEPTVDINEVLDYTTRTCVRNNSKLGKKLNEDINIVGTGLLLGGYLQGSRFLTIIIPDGNRFALKKFGAIGYTSEIVKKVFEDNIKRELSIIEAYELMVSCFDISSHITGFVNKIIFPYLLFPDTFFDYSEISMIYAHSFDNLINAHLMEFSKFGFIT